MSRPLQLVFRTSGSEDSANITLDEGEEVLVGREPEADDRDGTVRRTLTVPSPTVSSNHVTVRNEGGHAHFRDLQSRNGTWIRLPPKTDVSFVAPTRPVMVQLATLVDGSHFADAPSAEWTGALDYATSIVGAVEAWLGRQELPARISVADSTSSTDERLARFPLASGADILVEPLRTVGVGWMDALERVRQFIDEQNVQFETEAEMREEGLVIASSAMRKAVAKVSEIASFGARLLLLTGASGTGKEGLARCFHRRSRRAGPFVARNCAMFNKELVRMELFGAEKGAFTGSVQRIVGAVETANEGTLFLDELGELPREVQPMLLRFLDHGEYERLGRFGQSSRADVNIVCATNRDMRAAARSESFRADLWFRLSVHVVEVPPLRERFEDVVAYLRGATLKNGGNVLEALSPATLGLLEEYEWDGNFRELMSFAERLRRSHADGVISPESALAALQEGALQPQGRTFLKTTPPPAGVDGALERAAAMFAARNREPHPTSWDEMKDFIENYVKPVMFAELSGNTTVRSLQDVDLRDAAQRTGSDRGTAQKQLRRYLDLVGEGSDDG